MAEDASGPAAHEASGPPAPGARPRESKLASSRPGQYVTYVEDRATNYCAVGKVVAFVRAEEAGVVRSYRPVMGGRLR
eukprot:13350566-Alexandrium_andersonii.AAC.1